MSTHLPCIPKLTGFSLIEVTIAVFVSCVLSLFILQLRISSYQNYEAVQRGEYALAAFVQFHHYLWLDQASDVELSADRWVLSQNSLSCELAGQSVDCSNFELREHWIEKLKAQLRSSRSLNGYQLQFAELAPQQWTVQLAAQN
ncbi:prepilin-type N-terminal cleavage/methylation domain-containing protein [Alginatibacterium sediminis]|uniref:Prepilin-type N-terminal cleavage/methylation domain-containing protein n=1 Tax=Alginatibacterium sediminis TaxID=2164068 RepID=A0A420EJS4_9ALTE|nr:prepilin-type N-terminal cleavage/methylation domain-containing protein [Alginatibacterium sediminis]RKF20923.1 prepilin-type N-terminal cleavage/methylation domain-containing protein [Alginatibacterium sediminis]